MTWYEDRQKFEGLLLFPVVAASVKYTETLLELNHYYAYIVIDTLRRAVPLCTWPSQVDLDLIGSSSETLFTAQKYNEKVKGYIVLNLCPTQVFINEANQAVQVLSQYPQFTLVGGKVYHYAWSEAITVY